MGLDKLIIATGKELEEQWRGLHKVHKFLFKELYTPDGKYIRGGPWAYDKIDKLMKRRRK